MAEKIEDLTIEYIEDDQVVTKELAKEVLTKGAWCTVVYRYQAWDKKKAAYGPDQYSVRRYQKRDGEYQQRSKFNISSRDQAEKMVAILQAWLAEPE